MTNDVDDNRRSSKAGSGLTSLAQVATTSICRVLAVHLDTTRWMKDKIESDECLFIGAKKSLVFGCRVRAFICAGTFSSSAKKFPPFFEI